MNTNNTTQELSKIEKRRLANRLSYQRNREKRSKATLDYYYKNRDKCLADTRQYYSENKEKHLTTVRSYQKKNKSKCIANAKKWYSNNKEKAHTCERIRFENNLQYKLVKTQRSRVSTALKSQKAIKNQTTLTLLGCTLNELKKHLESLWLPGMSWENYSHKGWHVDHIKPCNTFDLTDPVQQKECFHYSNLRPLWAVDNLSRPKDGSDIKEKQFN